MDSPPMNTPWISIVLFLVASLLGAVGQFLYKSGTDRAMAAGGQLVAFLANAQILGGVACYVMVMVCFVGAFRRGGAPSVLYPIYATTFIWAALIGLLVYRVPITAVHVLGMALIIAGMSLMGR
jgi:multidrug transporter EmrE-like cation transporter